MKKILLAGATGYIGKHLIGYLTAKGYDLSILTRKKLPDKPHVGYFYWNVNHGAIDEEAFEDVDTILNLTGASIFTKRGLRVEKEKL